MQKLGALLSHHTREKTDSSLEKHLPEATTVEGDTTIQEPSQHRLPTPTATIGAPLSFSRAATGVRPSAESRQGRGTAHRLLRKTLYRQEERKIVSIPTRYKTVLLGGDRSKGFGSSTSRFSDDGGSEIMPGPGSYSLYSESVWKDNKESQSRKGTGALASAVPRRLGAGRYLNTGPGPGSYSLSVKSDRSFDSIRSVFSEGQPEKSAAARIRDRLREQLQATLRMRLPSKPDSTKVGPGTYLGIEASPSQVRKVPNASKVVFSSKVPRQIDPPEIKAKEQIPGIGHYNLDRSLLKKVPFTHVGPSKAFANSVVKENILATDLEKIRKQVIYEDKDEPKFTLYGEVKTKTPGPGHYMAEYAKDFLTLEKHSNACGGEFALGSPRKDRPLPTKENPGPGTYKQKGGFDGRKYNVCSWVFTSEVPRDNKIVYPDQDGPIPEGNGIYTPEMLPNKEEFNCNPNKIWMYP